MVSRRHPVSSQFLVPMHPRNVRGLLAPLHRPGVFLAVLMIVPPVAKPQEKCAELHRTSGALSVDGKWWNFVCETANPLTAADGLWDGAVAHVTNTAPKYGTDLGGFGEQVGASTLNTATQNFFGDFVLASALHEDPRYIRRGSQYGMFSRAGYAISRAWRTRTDNGRETFNWSNVLGAAASTGLSYAYYPPASRDGTAMTFEFVTDVVGTGFANLAFEFWPDVRHKLFHRH